jgi:hypothetical protein
MEHPEPYSDTDPKAMEVWLDLQRRMSAGEKLATVLAASHLVLGMYEAGVRLQYPQADDREIFLRMAARHLDRDLMIRAYGWDPDLHANPGRRT